MVILGVGVDIAGEFHFLFTVLKFHMRQLLSYFTGVPVY